MNFSFDANDVGSTTDDKLKPGVFAFVCKQAELKPTRAGDGSYVNACFEVSDGPCKGKRVYNRFTYQNKSEKATEIGRKQLAQYCLAIGKQKISDICQLEGVPFIGTLSQRTEVYNGESRNVFEIVKFEAINEEDKKRIELILAAEKASNEVSDDNAPF